MDGKPVEGSVTINPTSSCGTAVINFAFNTQSLKGKTIVVFERLYAYKDDGNYDKEDPVVTHGDINDGQQTVDVVSLGTVATDGTDGDKAIIANTGAVIKDVVNYCVKPGKKYTIRGILMNKATGEPLLINGAKVEGAVEIEPTESCGSAEVFFHFDATGLQDTVVVVFESLFEFTTDTDDGDPIITHEDINDEDQAVVIYLTTPNTGHFTINSGGVQGTKLMIAPAAVALTLGGYVAYRIHARKRFLGRM